MHLKNPLLFGLLAILLLGGTITPVLSQSEPELQVIINEIETNPSGSDSGNVSSGSQEFVELYNPGMTEIDISGWSIQPSATWKKLIIPNNTVISPQSFLVFTHVNYWFKDFGETISLIDLDGNIIDQTPLLTDEEDDGNSWQRNTDGYDTDSISDWTLKRLTPKTSNGQIIEQLETTFNFTGQTDKTDYLFGESITISGSISEKLYVFDSSYTAEIIKVSISGPDYYKNLALFPDRSLNFSTTLNIQKVLGFNTGTYDVKLQYGENILNTTFKINDSVDSSSDVDVSEFVSLSTDKPAYIPGELVILSGDTNSLIPYGGLDYTVTDPDGNVVFEGTIFQNEKFSTVHQQGGGQLYAFSTQLYMSTVEPTYGEYYVNGVYKSQNPLYDTSENTLKTRTTFELKEDVKEDKIISLSTDKEIYALGEIIKLTGRSNEYWTESLNLEVSQTGVLSSDIDNLKSQHIRPDPFTLFDVVRVNGDGTFEYEFELAL